MKKDDKIIKDFIQPLRNIVLSDIQTQSMRERLTAYADLHRILRAKTNDKRSYSIFYTFSYSRLAAVLVAVAVLLVSGTGVTFAAENSVPGDPLYSVKIDVAEPIQGALVTGTENKAKWQNTLADRRLAEASTLAEENKLTPQTSAYLEQQVVTDAVQSNKDATTLEAAGNTDAALAVRSDLDARLSAHEAILALITPQPSPKGDATTTLAVANFLARVNSIDKQIVQEEDATELALANSATTTWMQGSSTAVSVESSSTAVAYIDAENISKQHEERAIFTTEARLFGVFDNSSTTASTSPLNSAPPSVAASTTSTSASWTPAHHSYWHAELPIATSTTQLQGNL